MIDGSRLRQRGNFSVQIKVGIAADSDGVAMMMGKENSLWDWKYFPLEVTFFPMLMQLFVEELSDGIRSHLALK